MSPYIDFLYKLDIENKHKMILFQQNNNIIKANTREKLYININEQITTSRIKFKNTTVLPDFFISKTSQTTIRIRPVHKDNISF